ncbi:MAG: steroid delta-isomerase [Alphaproteobacteria bacterium]|nr:steroid delta-isomerase [Alphaproteobacteria bacterium]
MEDNQSTHPAHCVQQQLEVCNARDVDAFMRWWAEDCCYYGFSDQPLAKGVAEVREQHLMRFREPNSHGRLITRLCLGNLVIDREVLTRTFPEGPGEVDVIALYEVGDGEISKAWFKMGEPRLLNASP